MVRETNFRDGVQPTFGIQSILSARPGSQEQAILESSEINLVATSSLSTTKLVVSVLVTGSKCPGYRQHMSDRLVND